MAIACGCPPDWQPSLDVSTSEMTAIRLELGDFGFDASNPEGKVRLATTSLGPEVMTRLAGALNTPLIHSVDQARPGKSRQRRFRGYPA